MIPDYDSWFQLYEGGNEDKRRRDFTGMFVDLAAMGYDVVKI